jgi:hypothetical protein
MESEPRARSAPYSIGASLWTAVGRREDTMETSTDTESHRAGDYPDGFDRHTDSMSIRSASG